MIERFFKRGVLFEWNKPANVDGPRDSTIVDSIRPASPVIYKGLEPGDSPTVSWADNLIDPVLRMNSAESQGYTLNAAPFRYDWLDYVPGRTGRKLVVGRDILTGFMSGCLIAHDGMRAYHVGTVEVNIGGINDNVKHHFREHMPRTTRGFDPSGAWTPADRAELQGYLTAAPGVSIVALVTASGDFYSIAMMGLGRSPGTGAGPQNYYCCGGIRRVNPISYHTLYNTTLA